MAAVTPARSRSGPAAQLEVEQELARLLRRGRLALSAYAARIHPDIDVSGYTLLLAVRDATTGEDGKAVRAADLAGTARAAQVHAQRGLAQLESRGWSSGSPTPPTPEPGRCGSAGRELAACSGSGTSDGEAGECSRPVDEGDLRTLVRLLDRRNTDLE